MPIVPTLLTHDLLLSDGTTTLGLVIEKDKNGLPIFNRLPAESLATQEFQDFSQAIFPPQYQGFITQKEWHGGFGKQELTGIGTDNRYMQTHGVDCSVKGLKYPSPVVVATTNSNPTQTGYNTGFENWTTLGTLASPDNWAITEDSGSFSKDTSDFQGGAASLRKDGTAALITRQSLGVTAVNNSIITVTIYGRAITTNATIAWTLYDASETSLATQSDTVTAGAGWVQKTFTYTFTGTVSNPILEIKLSSATINGAWLDTMAITWTGTALTTLTMGTIIRFIDFSSNHYAITSTGVWKRTAADWGWVGGSPPGITDVFLSASTSATQGSPFMFLCRGSSLVYWLMRTNDSFLITSGTDNSAKVKMGIRFNGKDYGARDPNLVYKYANIFTATVTTTYTAQDSGHDFTAALEGISGETAVPFFIREGSAFYITSADAIVYIASELAALDNSNTGKNSLSWRGNGAQTLYMPAGAGASLMAYDDGLVDNIGPDVFAERLGDFKGQIVATASDDQWLYIILDNGTKIEIMKGRYESINSVTDFRWHPIKEVTYATVACAHVSSITTKRLYFGGGTALPQYIPLPTAFGDPLNDTGLTFDTAQTDESSWYNLNLPRITKTYLNCTVDALGLSATKTITIEYQLWESQGTWTELGGSGNGIFTTSPTQTKTFAASIAGRKIRFRATYTTDDTTVGYGMLQFTCRLALGPSRLDIFQTRVRVKNKNLLKNGNLDTEQTYLYVAPQLHTWKFTQPLTLTYFDGKMDATDGSHDGATLEVKFAEGYPREQFVSLGDYMAKEAPESIFDLMLVSIDRSVS